MVTRTPILAEALLDEDGGRLADGRGADVEREAWSRGPARSPASCHQRLGLVEIGAIGEGLRPCRLLDRRAAAIHRLGAAEERARLDLLVGHRPGDRLAQLDVVERRARGVERDVPERVRDRHADDLELALLDHLVEVLGRKAGRDVGVAALEHGAARAGRGDVARDHAPDLRQRTALPVVEAREDGLAAGLPAFDPVGAAAGLVGCAARPAPTDRRRWRSSSRARN